MIQFRDVFKSFGARRVLAGITFDVAEGDVLFVLGRSGTGKSVLLKSIVGLLTPDRGEILVNDRNVVGLDELALGPIRRECGMVFQHPALFDSLDVFENVAYGLRRHHADWAADRVRERVETCLEWVNMAGTSSKRTAELSFGMQKRVSLARTLALNPRTLLFDEPTTGLDPISTNAINRLIFKLSRQLKTTSIVVSHDMRCALEVADRIVVLDGGRVIADATTEILKRSTHPLVRDFLAEAIDAPAS